ncbi:hypothetical protein ACFYO1_06695 [Nocardia sp. NPDC006044]|uniref:hypothetical protein n=1 Tax=Nocardia sp. NPDC006044 TaxID=3364306 RepID=UPI00369A4D99
MLVRVAGVLAAVLVVASACGGDDGVAARGKPTTGAIPTISSAPGVTPQRSTTSVPPGNSPSASPSPVKPSPVNPSPGNPSPGNPPQAFGTAEIRTRTLSGTPVPNVPVHLSLVQPCDPASHDIPLGETTETLRRDAVTDGTGLATFSVPTGCYLFGLGTPPPGATPVPEGMHSLFLMSEGQKVSGQLRFEEPGLVPSCAAATIVHDLDDLGELIDANATVRECDGAWAVIVWDSHGDSQRIVRHAADGWLTYVYFPHDVCWTTAVADGVPARLRPYFSC